MRRFPKFLVWALILGSGALRADTWKSLKEDGLHDPSNPSIEVMQDPEDAFGVLPKDTAGNKVDWVRALQSGDIKPRASLSGSREVEVLDQDIIMRNTLPLGFVLFPHKPHTEWMSCENCHEDLFVSKAGENPINMGKILDGEYCGSCHGAVSFPLTECNRCHSVDPATAPAENSVDASDTRD